MLRAEVAAEQLQAAVEAFGIGIFEWKHDGNGDGGEGSLAEVTPGAGTLHGGLVTGSKRFFELYGWSASEDVPANAVWSKVDARDVAETRAAFERASNPEGNGSIDLVHRVAQPGGKCVWLHLRAQVRFEQVGAKRRPYSTTGSVVDITERRQLESELRLTQARFDEAVRGAQFGIFEHNHIEDPRAENLYWSPRLREIFGFSADEPGLARTMVLRIHEDDVERLHAAVARAHDPSGDGYYDVEHRYHHPILGLRWLLTRSSTYFTEVNGKRAPVRTVGAIIDVTARHRSEQEHEQRAEILDATIDFVAIARSDGTLVYLNRAARQFLGLAASAELSGLNLQAVHPPESLQKVWKEEGIPTAVRDGAWQGETEFLRHDGAVVPMSQVLLAHPGREGQSLFSTIARDVSRERQLEENLRQTQKMEAVGRLAGGIAHDFNNILSAILSFAYVASGDIGETGKGYFELQEIIEAGKRAAALTQQLLAFGRKQVLRPSIVDVGETLTRLSPMLERLMGEHIHVALSLDRGALRVKVDPTHLEQVLLNLALNARDAMDNGGHLGIECRLVWVGPEPASSRVDLKPGGYVVIRVSDTGIGMDGETQAHVFEPFFTTKPAGHGTGLGLATVFGIVKQSGGSVYVDSEVGLGSVFSAYFPSSSEPLSAERLARQPEPETRAGIILVAEDDPAVRQVVTLVLQRAGYTVMSAADPIEALAIAREHQGRIDLLLTDVVMPISSGKELAGRLEKLRPDLRVIYMSGYTDRDIVHRGVLDAGVDFLPKPITPARLLSLVAQVLGRKGAPEWLSANGTFSTEGE
jgi:two-component system cell cycle sensor histidine kinase/response regulator CckA